MATAAPQTSTDTHDTRTSDTRTKTPPDPYALADRTIEKLNRLAIRRFREAKQTMLIPGFDELTVLQACKILYSKVKKDNNSSFLDLFVMRYLEVFGVIPVKVKAIPATGEAAKSGTTSPSRASKAKSQDSASGQHKQSRNLSELRKQAAKAIEQLLSDPNPVTGYRYDKEVTRKQERCEESINAAQGTAKKQAELDKALRFWSQMTGQYVDAVSDTANVSAMRDAGVQYVRWHTQQDEKVCAECRKRDGKIYRIDRIPDKPHWRCRCYTTPLSDALN